MFYVCFFFSGISIFRNLCMYVQRMRCATELSCRPATTSAMDSSAFNSSAMDPPWIRPPWIRPPEKLHFAKEEKEIGTVAQVRVLNKGRLDSLGANLRIEKEIGTFVLGRVLNRGMRNSLSADLRIEKEQGRVAEDRRLRRKGKLD